MTTTYLINQTPSKVLDWQTPFALINGTLPDYSVLQVFGCLCFASTFLLSRHKFSPRAIPNVFIGCLPGVKRYRLFDIENQRLYHVMLCSMKTSKVFQVS